VRWASWDGRGLEHLRLDVEPGSVRADSVILAVADDGRPYRAGYRIDSDLTAELAVDRAGLVLDYPGIARRV
jgi:hypothetical protein